jgi:predicted 3-demethylubiquinone-9 3-methyltransferase (glyoxalase superfamily)
MPKITPFLWFDSEAEAAARFYVSVFKNSKILSVSPMMVAFEIDGQKVLGLNGGPHFKLNEAFSFQIDCADQAEVDYFWEALLAGGGQPSQCGWLKDRFGLSWQVVPAVLPKLLGDPDRARANRAQQAMLKMVKLDIAALERAAAG